MGSELFQNIFVDSAQEVHSILQFVLGTIRSNYEVGLRASPMLVTDIIRIPTVKLKIPGNNMGKAEYRTSVTFKL